VTAWGAPVEKVDPDGEGQPLPFGGRQLLDALALGDEDRARALLRGFRTDKRRQRVLGSVRVAKFGFTAAHIASTCCGIELMQDLLHLAPQLIDFPALNGDTPLHVACLWKRRNTARLLVALGAQITTKNQDGETPIDLAPPKLGQRLIRDLNSILASWKGPLPYPNHGMGDDLALSEAQQRRRAQERALQEAEEEQERAAEQFKVRDASRAMHTFVLEIQPRAPLGEHTAAYLVTWHALCKQAPGRATLTHQTPPFQHARFPVARRCARLVRSRKRKRARRRPTRRSACRSRTTRATAATRTRTT